MIRLEGGDFNDMQLPKRKSGADLNLTDMETCYKAFKRDIYARVIIEENRFSFEAEITAKIASLGAKIYKIGIPYAERTYEEGKKFGWKDCI